MTSGLLAHVEPGAGHSGDHAPPVPAGVAATIAHYRSYRFAPTHVDPRSPLELNLTRGEITTVFWATGFRPGHSWLDVPAARDRTGRLRLDGGVVTGVQGLYVLGMPVLRTRASTYIHGAAADSEALEAGHLCALLASQGRTARVTTRGRIALASR